MSWHVTRSDKSNFRAENGNDYIDVHLDNVSQTFQGEWYIAGLRFNVDNCSSLEEAKNQLDQQFLNKTLDHLSSAAIVLKDFKIEGN